MKMKYRLTILTHDDIQGQVRYQIEAKPKGIFSFLFKWSSSWIYEWKDYDLPFSDYDEAMDAIKELRNRKPIKKRVIFK